MLLSGYDRKAAKSYSCINKYLNAIMTLVIHCKVSQGHRHGKARGGNDTLYTDLGVQGA